MYSEQDLVRYLFTKTNVISKRSEKTAVVGTGGDRLLIRGPGSRRLPVLGILTIPAEPQSCRSHDVFAYIDRTAGTGTRANWKAGGDARRSL